MVVPDAWKVDNVVLGKEQVRHTVWLGCKIRIVETQKEPGHVYSECLNTYRINLAKERDSLSSIGTL